MIRVLTSVYASNRLEGATFACVFSPSWRSQISNTGKTSKYPPSSQWDKNHSHVNFLFDMNCIITVSLPDRYFLRVSVASPTFALTSNRAINSILQNYSREKFLLPHFLSPDIMYPWRTDFCVQTKLFVDIFVSAMNRYSAPKNDPQTWWTNCEVSHAKCKGCFYFW